MKFGEVISPVVLNLVRSSTSEIFSQSTIPFLFTWIKSFQFEIPVISYILRLVI